MSSLDPFAAAQVALRARVYVASFPGYSDQLDFLYGAMGFALLLVIVTLALRIRSGSFCESPPAEEKTRADESCRDGSKEGDDGRGLHHPSSHQPLAHIFSSIPWQ